MPPLNKVTDDVWVIEGMLHSPGLHLPVRTTIVRLPGGELIAYSPFDIDDELAAAIDAIGRVTWLVAPNTYHHMRIPRWLERWPDAALWSAAPLQKKRADLRFTGVLDDAAPPEWDGHVDHVVLAGAPGFGEVVLLHRTSGTVLAGDLVFNVLAPRGIVLRIFMRLTGVYRRLGMSRVWRFMTKDRARMRADLDRILAWDIARVVMAHGDIVDHDAQRRLGDAVAWMRARADAAALRAAT